MAMRSRVARLLASGFDPKLVATIAGIPYAQLVNLLKDPEFRAQVELAKLGGIEEEPANQAEQAIQESNSFKDQLAAAEIAALSNIQERIALMEDRSLLQAFQVLGQRRENLAKQEALSKAITSAGNGQGQTTVIINMPNIAVPELNISSQGEVVGVGTRSTVPLGREGLTALIEGELANEQLSKAGV